MKSFPLFFQKNSHPQEMESRNGIIYEFADFRLIPSEGLLLQDGQLVPLSLKAFATLVLLVERHGHLVQKSELIEEIWENAFVEEAAVSRCVWTIRSALGEDSKSSRFIQTIPRRGYRFVFPVSVVTNGSGAFRLEDLHGDDERDTVFPDEQPATTASGNGASVGTVSAETSVRVADHAAVLTETLWARAKSFFPRLPVLVGLAGIVFITTAFLGYYGFVRKSSSGVARSILVLPVLSISDSDRDDLYELGIANSLIDHLSSAEGITVRPFNAIARYADVSTDPLAAGREQKVDYVLAPKYQIADGDIKITSQLYNVTTGQVENIFKSRQAIADVFDAQDAIAADIGGQVMGFLSTFARAPSKKLGTDNEESYRNYLLALNYNEKRGRENGSKALDHIQKAVELDPNFARAWAAKGHIHGYFFSDPDRHDHYHRSIEAVDKALTIDPDLSDAHSARCFNKVRYEYDFAGAESACRRALELDPNSPLAHKLYSNFLYTRGRFDEALAEIKMAIDLQPLSYDNQQTYALALYFARKYDEAEAQWKQLIPLNPNHSFIYRQLIRSLAQQGKESEAFDYLIESLTKEKESDETINRFRTAYAKSGWRGLTLERITLIESREHPATFELARLYATINNKDNAFKFLERAYRERSNMMAVLKIDPELDSLRNEARFDDLVRRIEEK